MESFEHVYRENIYHMYNIYGDIKINDKFFLVLECYVVPFN